MQIKSQHNNYFAIIIAFFLVILSCDKNDDEILGSDPNPEAENNEYSVGFENSIYASIQDAVDNVPEGSTIELAPIVFKESININKKIYIKGTFNGKDSTTLKPPENNAKATTLNENGDQVIIGINIDPYIVTEELDISVVSNIIIEEFDIGLIIKADNHYPVQFSSIIFRYCRMSAFNAMANYINVSNCEFTFNQGTLISIGGYSDNPSPIANAIQINVEDCILKSNSYGWNAISLRGNDIYVSNISAVKCSFYDILFNLEGNSTISHSSIISCNKAYGVSLISWNFYNSDNRYDSILIKNTNIINNNHVIMFLGDLNLPPRYTGKVIFDGCKISGNNSNDGLMTLSACSLFVRDCDIIGNDLDPNIVNTDYNHIGLFIYNAKYAEFSNTIIAGNGNHGFQFWEAVDPTISVHYVIRNCTIAYNIDPSDNSNTYYWPRFGFSLFPFASLLYYKMVDISNTVFAFNTFGITGKLWSLNADCNNSYGNGRFENGEWVSYDWHGECENIGPGLECPHEGLFYSLNPDFNNPDQFDFNIGADSPLNSVACGQIGAIR